MLFFLENIKKTDKAKQIYQPSKLQGTNKGGRAVSGRRAAPLAEAAAPDTARGQG